MTTIKEIDEWVKVKDRVETVLSLKKWTKENWFFLLGALHSQGLTPEQIADRIDKDNKLLKYDGRASTLKDIRAHFNWKGWEFDAIAPDAMSDHANNSKSKVKSKDKEYSYEQLLKLFYQHFKPLQIDFRIPENDIFKASIAYFEHGYHVFPVGTDKKPLSKWRNGLIDYADWQLNPKHTDIEKWEHGLAVLGTDKHVFLDIDLKSDKHPDGLPQSEIDRIRTLFKGWHTETSKNGGLHIWAHGCLSAIDTRAFIGASDGDVMIKGKGSYIVAYPSPGYRLPT